MENIEQTTRTICLGQSEDVTGEKYLSYDSSFEDTDVSELIVVIRRAESLSSDAAWHDVSDGQTAEPRDNIHERKFRVFAQSAMAYGKYSEYMKKHGCACCALTTVLSGYISKYCELRPETIIRGVEKVHFPAAVWYINYLRPMLFQMPVTLFGISKILNTEGINNRYVRDFSDEEAVAEIKAHLLSGRPVIVETSRKRRNDGKIVDRNDKKYAGTNHTQILLGMTRDGKVIYADSAKRRWAGNRQRLKEAEISDMMNYMFPQQIKSDVKYYWGRKRTGGYLLIDEQI